MTDIYTLSVIGFFIIVGMLIYLDRNKIEFKYIIVMRRTKKFSDLIDKIAKINPGFWRIFSSIGVVAGIVAMLYGLFNIGIQNYLIAAGQITEASAKLILPAFSSTGDAGPGFILIPFWYWLITIFFILVPHELLHGIICRAHKIPLKSVGLMLLAIFPGAFVEPNERKLQKASFKARLRVFAAGTFANFIVAGLIFIALIFIFPQCFHTGIILESVNETSPAALAGLEDGMMLKQINGKDIKISYTEFIFGRGYMLEEVGNVEVGDTIIFTDYDNNIYEMKFSAHPETGLPYVGINYLPIEIEGKEFLLSLIPLLNMIWLFSFAVGVFNILPLYPLDGGLILQAFARKYFSKSEKKITKIVSIIVVLMVLFIFFGPSLMSV